VLGSGNITPHINLHSRRRSVVSFTLWRLCPAQRSPIPPAVRWPKNYMGLSLYFKSSWTLFPSGPTYNGPQFLHSFHTKIVVFNPSSPPQKKLNMINKQKTCALQSNCPCSRSLQLSTQLHLSREDDFELTLSVPLIWSSVMMAEPRPSLKVTWRRETKVYQLLLNGSRQSS
jgi:hypothetical protein